MINCSVFSVFLGHGFALYIVARCFSNKLLDAPQQRFLCFLVFWSWICMYIYYIVVQRCVLLYPLLLPLLPALPTRYPHISSFISLIFSTHTRAKLSQLDNVGGWGFFWPGQKCYGAPCGRRCHVTSRLAYKAHESSDVQIDLLLALSYVIPTIRSLYFKPIVLFTRLALHPCLPSDTNTLAPPPSPFKKTCPPTLEETS